MRTGTVAQALLRAVAGQLIQASRARQIERTIVRATTPELGGLHAPPTCADFARYSPAQLARLGLGARRAGALIRLCRTLELERLKTVPTGTDRRAPDARARARAVVGRRRSASKASAGTSSASTATSGSRSSRPRCGAAGSRPRRATSCSRRTANGRGSRACTSWRATHAVSYPCPCSLTCTSSTTRRPRSASCSPSRRVAGGSIVLTGGSTPGSRVSARGGARARLEQRHALVGRRALRAARRRALELPAREGDAARPRSSSRRARSTGSAARRRRPRRRRSSTRRSRASRSTSSCSASGRTGTWRRSSPARRSSTVTDRRATDGPAGPRAVGSPGHVHRPDDPGGGAGRVPRLRRRQSRCGRTRVRR